MPRKAKPKIPAVAPGQPYGVASEQRAALDALPDAALAQRPMMQSAPPQLAVEGEMARSGGSVSGPPPGAAMPGSPPPPGDLPLDALQAALMMEPPGMESQIDAPSARPDEPMTAGLPFGPGPTSTALDIGRGQDGAVAQVLQTVLNAAGGASPQLQALLEDARRRGA